MAPASREAQKIIIRLPEGMRDKLKKIADASRRSVNAQMIVIIEEHLSKTEAASEPVKTPPAA